MSQFSLIKYEKEMHNLKGEERLFWKGHDQTKEGEPAGRSLGSMTWLPGQWHRGQSGRVREMVVNQGLCLWPAVPDRVKGNVSVKIKYLLKPTRRPFWNGDWGMTGRNGEAA